MSPLDVDALFDRARQDTGLEDFGDPTGQTETPLEPVVINTVTIEAR